MTALSTSLALTFFNVESPYRTGPPALERMKFTAVYRCIEEQYWKKVLTKEAYERRHKTIIRRN